MRAVAMLLVVLSGCLSTGGEGHGGDPAVSMSVERNRNNDVESVRATLTGVQGPIDDWSDLDVRGCAAPRSGPIELPHALADCSWSFSIRYAPTGQVLYST